MVIRILLFSVLCGVFIYILIKFTNNIKKINKEFDEFEQYVKASEDKNDCEVRLKEMEFKILTSEHERRFNYIKGLIFGKFSDK